MRISKVNSFTLLELILVILLIGILYYLSFSSFQKHTLLKGDHKVELQNLRSFLLDLEFQDTISVKCTDKENRCYLFIDGELQEDTKIKLFHNDIEVYRYKVDFDYEKLEFPKVELGNFQTENVNFQYSCKKNRLCDEYIVGENSTFFLLSNLQTEQTEFHSLQEVLELFEQRQKEVRYAF